MRVSIDADCMPDHPVLKLRVADYTIFRLYTFEVCGVVFALILLHKRGYEQVASTFWLEIGLRYRSWFALSVQQSILV